MPTPLRMSQGARDALCCPRCHATLSPSEQLLACTNSACDARYPIVNGIPVLINDQRSIFSIADFASPEKTFFGTEHESKLKKTLRPFIPAFGKNIKARANYRRMRDLLRAQSSSPRVLVLGGSILGQGMGALIDDGSIEMVDSDVSFGPRTRLICDAHDIPFQDGWFDGVIIQAVLGNVLDPFRCVGEIHRVLKKQGLVYAETPFMQQNFSGRFDFTRFTHLGHRRLFRHFEEIDSGAACGPGMALACSYGYFLMSFAPTQTAKSLAMVFARMTSFFLKYVDHYLIDKPGTIDAAAGFYFLGRRSEDVLPDRELIRLYRGAMDVR